MRDLLGNLPRGLPGNTCTLTHALEMRRDSPAGTGQYLSFNGSECLLNSGRSRRPYSA